jgi:hypothetical protein
MEAVETISANSKYFQVIASDTITLLAPTINLGSDPLNPFLRIVDDCLLIDSTEPNGIRKLLIDVSSSSVSKPDYDGLLIRSSNNNVSTDITVQNSLSTPSSVLSFGVEGISSINGIQQEYIAFKKGNLIIPLQFSREFSSLDIGRTFYWVNDEISETITGISGFITDASLSTTNPFPNNNILTTQLNTSGTFTGTTRVFYKVQINDISSVPNKFRWSNDSGNTFVEEYVNVSLTEIELDNGVKISFNTTSDFILNDYWTFTAIPVAVGSTIGDRNVQLSRTINNGLSYITNTKKQDIVIKTSDQERLKITDNGQVSINNSDPTATFEVSSKIGKRLLLSTNYVGQQINPSVVGLNNGGWVAVWESYSETDSRYNIYGQIFYSDGTRNGNQFLINNQSLLSNNIENQTFPQITKSLNVSSNQFIVVWSSQSTNGGITYYDIMARMYDPELNDGSRQLGNPFVVNATRNYPLKYPQISGLPNGDYVVVWTSIQGNSGTNVDCYFRRIRNGTILGNETKVNSDDTVQFVIIPPPYYAYPIQNYPVVSHIDINDTRIPGGFVISYMSEYELNLYDIKYKLYDSNGTAYSDEITITDGYLSLISTEISPYTYGRVSVQSLYGGDFVLVYNQSYFGLNTKFISGQQNDNIIGLTSGTISTLNQNDPLTPTLIKVRILNQLTFIIGEEIQSNFSDRINKIQNIIYPNQDNSLDPDQIIIELSRDTKQIIASRFNTSLNLSENLVYTIQNINTTQFQNDYKLTNQITTTDWTRNNTIDNSYYTKPVITELFDKNFIISWSNGYIPNIYYQKFNSSNGDKIGDEKLLAKLQTSLRQQNPNISKVVNKSRQDSGVVIVYDAEIYDTSYNGVFAVLVNDDNSLLKIWNGNGNLDFSNQGYLGIGVSQPSSVLHIKSSSPVLTLQNTQPTNNQKGNGLSNSSILFKDSYNNSLAEIISSYTTNYQSRNPLQNNLIRWFEFDDGKGANYLKDSSKSNIQGHLIYFDVYNDWTDGKINYGLRFNNIGYIDCGSNINLINSDLTGFTVSCWIKIFPNSIFTQNGNQPRTIISTEGSLVGNYSLSIEYDSLSNEINAIGELYGTNGLQIIRTPINIQSSEWVNIVYLLDDSTSTKQIKLYINGVLSNSVNILTGTYTPPTQPTNPSLLIGTLDRTSQMLIGILDDVRIYNTTMTENDIVKLYQNIILPKGKLVFKTNNGLGLPDRDSVNNFTIDSDGYIENLKTRSLPDTTLTGTITTNGLILTGDGTKFLSEINIGDELIIENNTRIVVSILNDSQLTINQPFPGVLNFADYDNLMKRPSILTALDSSSIIRTIITSSGNVSIGGVDTGAKLVISGSNNQDDYPNLKFSNNTLGGGLNQILFYGTDLSNNKFQLGKIQTYADVPADKFNINFNLIKNSLDTQILTLNNSGNIGLFNDVGLEPQANIHIRDSNQTDVNILLESGSNDQAIKGGASSIIFKSKNVNSPFSRIIGSSDSEDQNTKGRIDFITNNGENDGDIQRLTIKSNNGISFYLPEPLNTFHISPLQINGIGTITLNGTNAIGVGTAFDESYIGKIIYFKTSKLSKLITSVLNSTILTVSEASNLPSQNYAIYKPGFNIDSQNRIGMGLANQSSDVHFEGTIANGILKLKYEDIPSEDIDLIGGNYDMENSPCHTLLVDSTGGVITIKLPDLLTCKGRIYTIKRINSDYYDSETDNYSNNGANQNEVIIDGFASQKIDSVAKFTLNEDYKTITIQSDGINKWNLLIYTSSTGAIPGLESTDYLPEGNANLYFTDERAINAVINGPVTTNDISESGTSNLYFTNARAINAVADLYEAVDTLSTAFDPIGSSIAVKDYLLGIINNIVLNDFDTDNVKETGTSNLYFTPQRVLNVMTGTNILPETGTSNLYFTHQRVHDVITGTNVVPESGTSNLYFTHQRVHDVITGTDVVSETGTSNLYFTEQRVYDVITGTEVVPETGTSNLYFTDQRVHSVMTGTDVLPETGTSNLYFTTERVLDAIQETFTTININESGTSNLYFTAQRVHDVITGTNVVPESGSSNLYFTNQRVRNVITGTDVVSETGTSNLYFTHQRVHDVITGTDVVSETGTSNLYFTPQRVLNVVQNNITTDIISESGTSNLYFTPQRVIDTIHAIATTIDLNESGTSNLYFTSQRVQDVITGTNVLSETGTSNLYFTTSRVINALQSSATTIDLNESGTSNLYFTPNRVIDTIHSLATTNDLVESGTSNLYFTPTRVIDTINSLATTIDLNESGTSNLYFTPSRVIDTINSLATTNDLNESGTSNLYFTPQRVIDVITGTDVLSETGSSNLYFTTQRVRDVITGTDVLSETGSSNLYFTTSRVINALQFSATTNDLNESGTSNLYFTPTRVINTLHSSATTIDLNESGTSNLYFTPQRVISVIPNTDSLPESGTSNLYFTVDRVKNATSGLYDAINTLSISFDPIGSAQNAENNAISYINNSFTNLNTNSVAESGTSNLYFTTQRVLNVISSNITTNNVNETGTSNLYFTNQRVRDVITGTNVLSETGTSNLYFTPQRVLDVIGTNLTTIDVDESGTSNLYFTNQRVLDVITGTDVIDETGTSNLYFTNQRVLDVITGTDIVSETGTSNLYFTEQRVLDVIGTNLTTIDVDESGTSNLYFTSQRVLDVITGTDVISETGTSNLYFTNQRVLDVITGTDVVSETGTSNLYFTSQRVLDVITGTDVLSETGTSNIYFTSQRVLDVITGTDVVSETGTSNLYFTPQRVLDVIGTNLTTIDVDESGTSNLYFTNQRVLDVITGSDVVSETGTSNLYFTSQRVFDVITGTDVVSETGTSNLYFTNQRVLDVITGSDVVSETGTSNLYFTSQRVLDVITGTDVVSETGTSNLYFTSQRVFDVITGTDVVSETGTSNLYFTSQRVFDVITGTDVVAETGTSNLYFTSQRVQNVITGTNVVAETGTSNLYFTNTRSVQAIENNGNLTAPGPYNIITNGNLGIQANTGNIDLTSTSGTIDINSNTNVYSSLTVGASDNTIDYFYLKNSSDNTKHWRIYVDASGDLNFDRYNGTSWINKSKLT